MAKKADSPVEQKLDDGEVSQHEMAPAAKDGKGMENGLGLEKFIPTTSTKKPTVITRKGKDAAPKSEKVEEPTTQPKAGEESQELPPRDEASGRFLPRSKKEDTPPSEDGGEESVESLKKRLKDTRDWATQLKKREAEREVEFKAVQQQLSVLQQKIDGSYIAPSEPTEEQKLANAKLAERVKISTARAEALYGASYVQEMIFDKDSPYLQLEQTDPLVKARVFSAAEPVLEAVAVLKEKMFRDKYGTNPDEWYANIRKEVEAEYVDELVERDRKHQTVESVRGLSNVNGVAKEKAPKGGATEVSLANLFPGFPTGSF